MKQPIILLILKALEGRGAERMVATLARAYADMGYSVHVLCLENTQKMPLDYRVQHHVVAYNQTHNKAIFEEESEQAAGYRTVAKRIDHYVLKNIRVPDLILANIYKVNWIMSYSQLPNIINVLHTALSKQFEQQLLDSPNHIIQHLKKVYGAHPCSCVSDGARKDLLTLIGNNLNRTTTIYNPCDTNEIKKSAAQSSVFERFGLTAKGYIIHVGSFDTMKNHQDLLRAYAKTDRQLPLVLVGEGKLEDEMKQLATQLGIDDSVKFLGFQGNPYPLIAGAALMVLTSKFEGFGYVIVEAQALGVPVISTDCPFGPKELLPEQNLIPVDDTDALATLMSQALANLDDYKVQLNNRLLPHSIARQYLKFVQVKSV
ncbi:glycosyltransferase [Psychrobacter sp. AOP3-A1-26]|uniref:glycosyltransferase n=1 Tax=Psychrobacter sp. AOP3-A1-26 TaxID=3457700 RepID=UPI0040358EC4